jgi:hypothetical protein
LFDSFERRKGEKQMATTTAKQIGLDVAQLKARVSRLNDQQTHYSAAALDTELAAIATDLQAIRDKIAGGITQF